MEWKSNQTRYGWISIAMHWLMVVLLVAVYAFMELKSLTPKGSPGRESMAWWHYSLGLAVFALVWLRLLARLTGAAPAVEPALPRWQLLFARAVQGGLYALMIALPLLGWLTLSARGVAIPFFGIELPALLGASKPLAGNLKEIHETLATAGYFLAGLHAAAALYHHYVRRDNTLRLMLGH
jgi:cytochrome b561